MSEVVHMAEPSAWIESALMEEQFEELTYLVPWAIPSWITRRAPGSLQRFATLRSGLDGIAAPGFTALELAARLYSRGRRERRFQTQFALRQGCSIWASKLREVRTANRIYAPSLAARRLFSANEDAEKVLLLDLPIFRVMHDDLDRAAGTHPSCAFLNRYRAPAWAVVEQECELAMADRIIVRGRFANQQLKRFGVPGHAISIAAMPVRAVTPCRERKPGKLRVLLAGLAAARHGAAEVLGVLADRPWLHIALRPGEGAEPRELLAHPRVTSVNDSTLSRVDAVIAPSLCETYLPEIHIAAKSGIPVFATLRGAGSVPQESLTIELPLEVERGLACALDALFGAEPSPHYSPGLVSTALWN